MQELTTSSQTLTEIIDRVAASDHDAFAQLYEHVSHRVHGLVLRVVRNPAIAAEVVQDVFLLIWVSAHKYRVALGSPESWIFTLAHRRAVDRVRSEQSSAGRDALYNLKADAVIPDTVDDTVHHTLMTESVQRCLASLTTLQAEAIKLAYYKGLTYVEVAEALGIKVSTAKSRIQAGLIKLREAMEADGYDAHSR